MNNSKFVWYNQFLPQTLMSAMILLYFRGALDLIFSLRSMSVLSLIVFGGYILGAFGIANLRWWGIIIGVISIGYVFVQVTFIALKEGASIFDVLGFFFNSTHIINTLFDIAIVALLVHPMSINYAKRNFTKRIP